MLAVGWVPVDGLRIDLSGGRRHVVRHDDPGEAVTIHGLTHDDLEEGRPLAEVLGELRRALAGRVLLAHHAPFELAFLDAAFRSVGEHPPCRRPCAPWSSSGACWAVTARSAPASSASGRHERVTGCR